MNIIFLFFIGAALGSFILLIIQRNERNESIVTPRSHCDSCKTTISCLDLIPIISYLILKGRCRNCQAPINKNILVTELVMGIVVVLQSYYKFHILIFISLIMLIILSIIDAEKLMVPTKLIILLLINNVFYYFIFNNGNIIYFVLLIGAYLVVQFINYFTLKIGSGDIDIIFIFMLVVGIKGIPPLIIIATIVALTYSIIFAKRNQIAFIPFLSVGYIITLLAM